MVFNVMNVVFHCLIRLCMCCFYVSLLSWSAGVGILGALGLGWGRILGISWGYIFELVGIVSLSACLAAF